MARTKQKAKRYTAEEKKEILDFITNEGRGGQTKAVKKFKVTAATISSWRKQQGDSSIPTKGSGGSKELRAIEELASILKEISSTEAHLAKLKKSYKKAKAKL